jgi:hypothetical protein
MEKYVEITEKEMEEVAEGIPLRFATPAEISWLKKNGVPIPDGYSVQVPQDFCIPQ